MTLARPLNDLVREVRRTSHWGKMSMLPKPATVSSPMRTKPYFSDCGGFSNTIIKKLLVVMICSLPVS